MSVGTQQVPIPWTPAPPQLVMAYSVCKGITRVAAKNFYYAFLVLPRRKREALCAVYAFMRRCDDIADDPKLSPGDRRQQLDTWLDALHRAQQGHPTDDAILLALTDAQRRFTIPAGLLDELAHGTAMDVEESESFAETGSVIHYKTFEDLRLYCYRVASVVGLVCIHVFGYRDPAAEALAEQCGIAFQLTNIIRDVKEDAGLGRVYLPEEDLAKCGLALSDVLTQPDPARLRPVLELEAQRARELYISGDELISYVSEDSQPALWVLINIYRSLLVKIAEKQYDVFTTRVALSRWEKLRILGKGFIKRLT
ncbi:MAG TPA: phytoene/squalene synthase family protein [Candidatus Dormibacteraeota bacterium]|nr:phytoene/squalene synthase family protein [Candidatus Dormibacteraeota bacterium]